MSLPDTQAAHRNSQSARILRVIEPIRGASKAWRLLSIAHLSLASGQRRSWHHDERVRLGGCPGFVGPIPSAGLDECGNDRAAAALRQGLTACGTASLAAGPAAAARARFAVRLVVA